jgi:hypothetical protein
MAGKATSAEDVMRGVAGGAILGVPLLYTQETWLHGRSVSPVVILAGVIATFVANVALSYPRSADLIVEVVLSGRGWR